MGPEGNASHKICYFYVRRQHKLYFPCIKKKQAEMLLLGNVQMNTDFGTLHNADAERSTCKASILVFCCGTATERSDTTVSATLDLYRDIPIWKILCMCCLGKKHSKELEYMKGRREWWRLNACAVAVTYRFRNVMTAQVFGGFFIKFQLWNTWHLNLGF